MSRLRGYLAAALVALAASAPAPAQEAETDRGFLTEFLESNLSGAGRAVRIEGFEGALSSQARIAELTVADAEGVWLTIRDATLSWSRAALLRGRVEIGELTAAEIEIARAPVAEAAAGLPDPGATAFRLPELPVAVNIGTIRAAAVRLGAPLLGEEVGLSVAGALRLEAGEGAARLEVERIDGRAGSVTLDASFENASGMLKLDLALSEPQGGLAATLMNLPGRPAMDLRLAGEGPVTDFALDVTLASDGVERLAGQAVLEEVPDPAGGAPARRFALDLAGDLAPLFLPEFQGFFGPDVRLAAEGRREVGGVTRIERLEVAAAALALDGTLVLAADGLPQSFALSGRIAAPGGGPVRLPVAGPETELGEALIEFNFDAAQGAGWSGAARISGVRRGADRVAEVTLKAEGEIGRDGAARQASARIALAAGGLAPADAALAEALGATLEGRADLAWREGAPLILKTAAIETANARLVAAGTVGPLAEALPFAVRGTANLADLSVFSGLAGRELGGRLVLALNGTTRLLDGRFDLRAGGAGRDLSAGIAVLDRAIAGESRIGIEAARDETGIELRRLEIAAAGARITAQGQLRPGATDIAASARLEEAGRVVPGLQGPGAARVRLRETGPGRYATEASAEGPGTAELRFEGELAEGAGGALAAEGLLSARVARLDAYAAVAGRRLSGALDLTAEGKASLPEQSFDLKLDLTGGDLALGQPSLDLLLGGRLAVSADLGRSGDTLSLRRLSVESAELSAEAQGSVGRAAGRIEGAARLRDAGIFAPDFPGPLALTGAISHAGTGRWGVDLSASGPGNTLAEIAGTVDAGGEAVNLTLKGEAPLGLANAAIAPRAVRGRASFDLAMRGAPGLPALSGRITTEGARLVAPTYGVAVAAIGGAVSLGGGRAAIDIAGNVEGGGSLAVQGAVALAAPNQAELGITLNAARFADADLFETTVSGRLAVTGPLTGGGQISGALDIGTTELRLAATGLGAGGDLPGLRHLNEPAAVRLSRLRAGLVDTGAGSGTGARPFGLDLTIRAPGRIFIRGRGLDAELGGTVRLAGTTSNVLPQGRFDLIRGRLDILGRRLALDEGFARLEGSFDPYIRLVASTAAEAISVRVIVEGLASAPEIRFESTPELPEDEVLARLFFGRGIDELSPLQAARLASAVATLAGRGGGGVVDRLRQNFGLDDLDVTTGEGGAAALRAGRYISEKVYSEVTIGADGTSDISINLDVSPSLTVKGSAGSDGDTGLGIFFERDY